jgi:hypothetical protein
MFVQRASSPGSVVIDTIATRPLRAIAPRRPPRVSLRHRTGAASASMTGAALMKNKHKILSVDGCLGSRNVEERSEMRYVIFYATTQEGYKEYSNAYFARNG